MCSSARLPLGSLQAPSRAPLLTLLSPGICALQAAQQQYLLKRKAENQSRLMKGEEPLPEEDLSQNQLFKPMPQPSRLESLLISNQMQAYCQQINQFSGQSFAKLFLMQSLNQ